MKEKRFSAMQVVAICVGAVAVTLLAVALTARLLLGSGALTMLQGFRMVEDKFVGEYTTEDAVDGAMDGMVTALGDRWSYYLTKEQYESQQARRANVYVGIGVSITYEAEGGLLVKSVEPGGGAEQAGIVPGDLIIAVGDVPLVGEAQMRGAELIQGEAGTTVTVTVRGGDGVERTVTLMRQRIETHPVSYQVMEGGVGYIRLANFYQRSADELKRAVEALQSQGVTALLFDVRQNPGGYLPELIAMLDYLLPEGDIFRSHGKNAPTEVVRSDAAHVALPMAVLVDAESYSAAELFAAQLRESAAAPIVGAVTVGKGYSQQTFRLRNGGALNISTAAYTTGSGVSLVGVGLTPDKVVALDDGGDAQLAAALEILAE